MKENLLKSVTVSTVCSSKEYYSKGQTFDDFIKKTGGDSKLFTPNESKFMKEVFSYLEKNSSNDLIFRLAKSSNVEDLINDSFKLSPTKPTPPFASFRTTNCRFWCKLGRVFVVIGEAIQDIVCIFDTGEPCKN
jgi:hypothetical protein